MRHFIYAYAVTFSSNYNKFLLSSNIFLFICSFFSKWQTNLLYGISRLYLPLLSCSLPMISTPWEWFSIFPSESVIKFSMHHFAFCYFKTDSNSAIVITSFTIFAYLIHLLLSAHLTILFSR